ncbi:fucolectin-1-like [Hemitrygon akajei]|uniref:fucolectin-1-like n=1 Tax=Hemitrygon akajei TaxID=2704970 RepID=UPI003BF9F2A8
MDARYLLVFVCVFAVARAHHSKGNLCDTIRATQSSISDFKGYALNAIDRNHDTNYQSGSCSKTTVQHSPWWSVDFFYHYMVFVVKITAGLGVTDAEIRIGDSMELTGKNNAVCAKDVSVPAGETRYFFCKPRGLHGRFMTIIIPRKTTSLSLCEVEAYGAHDPH